MLQKEKACVEFQCYDSNGVFISFFNDGKTAAKYAREEILMLVSAS